MKDIEITNYLHTRKDQRELSVSLDFILSEIFKNPSLKWENLVAEKLPSRTSQLLISLWQKGNPGKAGNVSAKSENSSEVIKNFLDELKEQIMAMPVLELIISFEPTSVQLDLFCQKARESFNPELILDWRVEPEIVGGAKISYHGKYWDFSLEQKVQDTISKYLERHQYN